MTYVIAWLISVNLSFERLWIFGCTVMVRIPHKIRKTSTPKARKALLLHCLSYGKYRIMIAKSHRIQAFCQYRVVKNQFPMRNWRNVDQISRYSIEHEETVRESMEFELADYCEVSFQ